MSEHIARGSGRKVAYSYLVYAAVALFVPKLSVGQLALGLDDLLVVLAFCHLSFLFFRDQRLLGIVGRGVYVAMVLILATGIVGGMIQNVNNSLSFLPTEMWQYVKRFAFFLIGGVVLARRLHPTVIHKWMVYVFVAAGLLGMAQVFSPWATQLSSLYAVGENDFEMAARHYAIARVVGTTGFSVSWGILAAVAFAFSLAFLLLTERHRLRYWDVVLHSANIILSVLNVVLSGSRGSLFACVAAVEIVLFLSLIGGKRVMGRWLFRTVFVTVGGVAVAVAAAPFLAERFEYIQSRMSFLVDELLYGFGRSGQIEMTLAMLDGPVKVLFGAGARVLHHALGWGRTEVEPAMILVSYGIVGFCLRYWFIGTICVRYLKGIRGFLCADIAPAAAAFLVYLLASLFYYFLHEISSASIIWLMFGYAFVLAGFPARPLSGMMMSSRQPTQKDEVNGGE